MSSDKLDGFLEQLAREQDDFRSNRWRCIRNPKHAAETLGPCARLDLTVVSARGLVAWTQYHSFEAPSRPYVKVFLNDKLAFETAPVRTSNLRWDYRNTVDFAVLTSMIRLEVVDYDRITHQEGVGFVEFCVGELPWNEMVDGWLELRLYDRLERTSEHRYRAHLESRDDESVDELRQSLLEEAAMCNMSCTSSNNRGRVRMQKNAGEVHVQMRLERLGTWMDSAFASALDPPPSQDFGLRKLAVDRDGEPVPHMQDLGDHVTELKLQVVDGALASAVNFFGYILEWRSYLLSAAVSATLICTWLVPVLTWVLLPALVAVLLFLLGVKDMRDEMTLGGQNAPLTQEGLEYVAAWRNTRSMVRFLRRIVENELQGKVINEEELYICAAHCFSNGNPKVSFDHLREGLLVANWTSSTRNEFAPGAFVVVQGEDNFRSATVLGNHPSGVRVRYGDGCEDVKDISQVAARLHLPNLPTWMIPESLSASMREVEHQMRSAKNLLLKPVDWLTQVLSWKNPAITSLVVISLFLVSAAEGAQVVGVFGGWPDEVGHAWVVVLEVVLRWIKTALHWSAVAAGMVILVFQSTWLTEIRSLLRIAMRSLCWSRRDAPKHWPFFRIGSEAALFSVNVANSGKSRYS